MIQPGGFVMRIVIIILIIIISTVFMLNCGRAPTGQTDYTEIRRQMESGEVPPPDVPSPEERAESQELGEEGEEGT
jgi:hypothetical protein